jgi:hypothetical protein
MFLKDIEKILNSSEFYISYVTNYSSEQESHCAFKNAFHYGRKRKEKFITLLLFFSLID